MLQYVTTLQGLRPGQRIVETSCSSRVGARAFGKRTYGRVEERWPRSRSSLGILCSAHDLRYLLDLLRLRRPCRLRRLVSFYRLVG